MLNIHPPGDNADSDLKRKASVLKKVNWSVLAIITLSFGVNMLIQPENILRYSLILVLLWSGSLTMLYYAKKGYIYISAVVYLSFLLLMIFLFSWTGGGIKGHGIKILPIVVLLSGLILGKKEIWIFGIVAILGGLGLTLADYFHQLPVTEALGQTPLTYWTYNTAIILLLCLLENMSVEELRNALAKSRKELIMRKESEKLLEEKNKKLTEIAFLQSHQVRRPVANILGLVSLLKANDPDDPANVELIPRIAIATNELDAVIKEIVQKTGEIESMSQSLSEQNS